MNIKKIVSAFSALAIAGSVFSGLAVTAGAEPIEMPATLVNSGTFKVMSQDTDRETITVDVEKEYANSNAKSDWVSNALFQYSFTIPAGKTLGMLESAIFKINAHNVNQEGKPSTLSLYSTAKADYNMAALTMADVYTGLPTESGRGKGGSVNINGNGPVGAFTEIGGYPSIAGNATVDLPYDVAEYVKSLTADESGTVKVSLAVSNSNRGVEILGKGSTNPPKLELKFGDAVEYTATINTAPYAKVEAGDKTVYSDHSGKAELKGVENTTVNYKVTKGGYGEATGSITFDEDKTVDAPIAIQGEGTLFYEDFNTTGVANQAPLYNAATVNTAVFRLNNNALEAFSDGNGTRASSMDFSKAIETDGSYTMSFDLSGIYMRQNKGGDWSNVISFVDNAGTVIFSIVPTFTGNKVSTGLKVNDVIVTENDLASGTYPVTATVNGSDVTVKIGDYKAVTVTTAAGATIKGMTQTNNKYICAKIDNLKVTDYTAPVPATPATATYTKIWSSDMDPADTYFNKASAYELNVTAGTEAVTSVTVKSAGVAADKTIEVKGDTPVINGTTVVFGIVVENSEDLSDLTAVINDADVETTFVATPVN